MTKTHLCGIGSAIADQMGFLREINDVKRLYAHNLGTHSYTSLVFFGAAKAIHCNEPLQAAVWCAAIVSAARLGAITSSILRDIGIGRFDRTVILKNSILVQESITKPLLGSLVDACELLDQICVEDLPNNPDWVTRLAASPRAGATCPGKPRIALEPAEMHSDHCVMVATYGFLLADTFGADREDAWLIGLCHHLHNAYLPDAGFTGEVLLGNHLDHVINSLRSRVFDKLPAHYRNRISSLFDEINDVKSPLAQTFHAADTIDRVVQMEHYERAAQFRVAKALEEFNLVHEGTAQEFQHTLLQSIGILYKIAA